MKVYLSIDTREDCPQENSGAYPVLVFRCSICGTELTKPPYNYGKLKLPVEERMKDRREFADLFHPLERSEFSGGTKDVSSCVYAGKYFEGPLVELREVTGP